jgi:hypothetical protein
MIVIVQPWFAAVGHPAQSLINLAKTMGNQNQVIYLISVMSGNASVEEARSKLKVLGNVVDCSVKTPSIREGTLKTLRYLKKLLASEASLDRVFFWMLISYCYQYYGNFTLRRA